MPRGKQLSDIEKQRIIDLRSCGKTQREIANAICRSQSVVKNFLKQGIENYGKKKRSGRPSKFAPTVKRAVLRELSKTGVSSSNLVRQFNLDCHPSLVRKWAVQSKRFKYDKYINKPVLKSNHIAARLAFAEKYIKYPDTWQHVIFSDEKKFNLDGPDGSRYYWHDLRLERKIMSRRVQGGGSIIVWAGMSRLQKTELAYIKGRLNAASYQNLLHDHLLPFITLIEDKNVLFQQDNAPCHTASTTLHWFQESGIKLLEWPPSSPDLNPIENLWGILARKVYDQNKPPIANVRQLQDRLQLCWAEIESSVLVKLVDSMPDRLVDVLKNKGKWTKY